MRWLTQKPMIKIGAFLFLLISFIPAYSDADSDYLKSLDEEAERLRLDGGTEALSEQKDGESGTDAGLLVQQPSRELDISAFESLLERNFMGSFRLYKRLDPEQRNEVYRFYRETRDAGSIRSKILELRKKQ